jgi:excisionase family DNA binding protein
MNDKLISIQEAAKLLNISIITLRRWEAKGLIKPERTDGNHRRFHLKDIEILAQQRTNPKISQPDQTVIAPQQVQTVNQTGDTVLNPQEIHPADPLLINYKSIKDYIRASADQQDDTVADYEPSEDTTGTTNAFQRFSFFNKSPLANWVTGVFSIAILALVILGMHLLTSPASMTNGVQASSGEEKSSVNLLLNNFAFPGKVASNKLTGALILNIPAILNNGLRVSSNSLFNGNIKVNNKNVDLGTGRLTASNVLYSINAGQNITITGSSQNPTISAKFSGILSAVTSIAGATGSLSLGSGLTLSGNTLSNSNPGSSQDIFKNIAVGGTTITAGSNNRLVRK